MSNIINIALLIVLVILSVALITTITKPDIRQPVMSSADAAYVTAYMRKIKAGNCTIYQYGYGWTCEALDGSNLLPAKTSSARAIWAFLSSTGMTSSGRT